MEKSKEENLKQLIKAKESLQKNLSEFLADKEGQSNYALYQTLLNCLTNFHYDDELKFFYCTFSRDFYFPHQKLDSDFNIGVGLGILYSVIGLFFYGSDVSCPNLPTIPDSLDKEITIFLFELQAFIYPAGTTKRPTSQQRES